MSRVAIIGSCITRDLWPIQGDGAESLLYVSRTSLPSLLAQAVPGFAPDPEPPGGLTRSQHRWVVSDLAKLSLNALVAHRPTHIIFDFIDERFDLLGVGGALATHSWELEASGYLGRGGLEAPVALPRLSSGVEALWREACAELAGVIAASPLRDAAILLHEAQWARAYRDEGGREAPFEEIFIWGDRRADPAAHNAMLRDYQAAFREHLPQARTLSAPDHRIGDLGHRWGLSPFHYAPEYYREIWRQLRAAGL